MEGQGVHGFPPNGLNGTLNIHHLFSVHLRHKQEIDPHSNLAPVLSFNDTLDTKRLENIPTVRVSEKHSEDVLTMSCVKVEMSDVELSGRLIARRPSFGWRITLNVMTLFEELLKSFVTASKSSLVRVVEDP